MENLISLPIDNFIKNEVEEVKERRRKYDKASSQYNSALSKLSGLKKKEINALRTMEVWISSLFLMLTNQMLRLNMNLMIPKGTFVLEAWTLLSH